MLNRFLFIRTSIILLLLSGLLPTFAQTINPLPEKHQQPDTTIVLEKVTIEGFRLSSHLRTFPGNLSVLAGKDFMLSDGTNLATTLNTLPGINMQSGTYATNRIVIRGMGSRTPYNTNRIRSYLNDIPITTSDGISAPEEIDAQNLGRIEVIRGPSSALYGSGLGGSVNLFTPEKLKNEGNFSLNYGSFSTLKTNISGTLNTANTHLWGSLSHLQSDGYRENNEFRRTSFLTTAKWKQSKWTLKSTLLLTDSEAEIPSSLGKTKFENEPQAAAANWAAIEGHKKNQKAMAGLSFTNFLSSTLTQQLSLHGKWSDNYEKRPFNNLSDQTLSAGIRGKLSHYRRVTDWVLGIDWITEQYKWKLDQDNILLNENRETRNQFSAFAILNYRLTTRLSLSVAGTLNHIRYRLTDMYAANGDQSGRRNFPVIVSPRLGLNYIVGEHLSFYASAGHGFSMPSPEETLLPAGDVNPDIKPEQGMQYETGTRVNLFGNAVEAEVSIYWIELNNLLVTKRITEDIFTGMNAGKTRHQGLELMVRNRIFDYSSFPGKLKSSLSYTFSRNRFIDFTDDGNTYNGNTLPGIPGQYAQLQLLWTPDKKLELSTHLQYTGSQYLNDANTLDYEGYFLINLKASTQFSLKKTGNFHLSAGVNNLTNTHYASMLLVNTLGFGNNEPRYYYPGLPRHFYAGVTLRF
ncbi:MAG: TonB-dependent receptor [Lentimicrobium sp.]|jgi:iron complex outermembrane receptor protein|nr:TonB-dependent receptor [Lentimicrobium sp.]